MSAIFKIFLWSQAVTIIPMNMYRIVKAVGWSELAKNSIMVWYLNISFFLAIWFNISDLSLPTYMIWTFYTYTFLQCRLSNALMVNHCSRD